MSGLAVNTETNGSDITIKSGAMNNVHVDLTRIVGRVDLYSNADNLVITGARMEKAAEKGYLMADHSLTSTDMPGEIDVLDINANAGVAASGEACLPAANAGYSAEISTIQQYNDGNGTGVRKAFYMYERDNSEGDCTQIVVSYALADGTTGEAVVPFTKTDETTGEVSYVNIERNHLYKVVLGNGEDITPGSQVEVKIIDEPWNVVDLPVVVEGPDSPDVVLPTSYDVVIDAAHPSLASALKAAGCEINVDNNGAFIEDSEGVKWLQAIESLSIEKASGELIDDDWTFLKENILRAVDATYDGVVFKECHNENLEILDFSGVSFTTTGVFDGKKLNDGHPFKNCPIKTLTIPVGVKRIASKSFYGMTNLNIFYVPYTVERIESDAFAYCSNLMRIDILENIAGAHQLTEIGSNAFKGCMSLVEYDLRDSKIINFIPIGYPNNSTISEIVTDINKYTGLELTEEDYMEKQMLHHIYLGIFS